MFTPCPEECDDAGNGSDLPLLYYDFLESSRPMRDMANGISIATRDVPPPTSQTQAPAVKPAAPAPK
jgi:hypothetical protein